jgi:hypothetical protein
LPASVPLTSSASLLTAAVTMLDVIISTLKWRESAKR